VQQKQEASVSVTYDTAMYVRLSLVDSGKDDNESIVNQQCILEQYIEQRPELILRKLFADNGETGVNFIRPAWSDLMSECRAGNINCIVVKDLSRVGRNYIETGEYLEKIFPMLGIRLIAVNDNYDSLGITTNERLTANLKNLVNDIYAKDISKKTRTACITKQKNGDFIGAYAPYGYMKSPENRSKLIIDPETAPIVRQIFRWKAEGAGHNEICDTLNEADIPSPFRYRYNKGIVKSEKYTKSIWMMGTIKAILTTPVYLGHTVQGKTVISLCDNIPRTFKKPDEWVVVENTHEPIVTQELYDEVQIVVSSRAAQILENKGKYEHLGSSELILKGLVYCADCGNRLYRRKQHRYDGSGVYWTYICQVSTRQKNCPHKYIHESDLYKAVSDAISIEVQKCADIKNIVQNLNSGSKYKSLLANRNTDIEEAIHEIKRIESLRRAVFEDYAAKVLTASEYKYALRKYNLDSEAQRERLTEAKHAKDEFARNTTTENKWIAAFTRFIDKKELTAEMANALIERIEVSSRDKVTVKFKFRDEYAQISEFTEVA
jgi:DNA invertase Pin-like site-specific DNA recombinase